jgi:predicted nucleic acid-binding protein
LSQGWIVDASVGVKPYLPEDLDEVARELFNRGRTGRASLYVPDLFYIECANIFWKHVRRQTIPAAHARRSLRNLNDVILFPVSSTDLLLNALDLALDFGITAYDASYVALAEDLNLPLITADRKLIGKLDGSGVEVRWLGDLPA